MQKIAVTIFVAALFVVPLGSVSAASLTLTVSGEPCLNLTQNLHIGLTNAVTHGQVSLLQAYLNSGGYLAVAPTGYFGVKTFAAVQKLQGALGVSPTSGYVGILTRAALACNTASPTRPAPVSSLPPVSNPLPPSSPVSPTPPPGSESTTPPNSGNSGSGGSGTLALVSTFTTLSAAQMAGISTSVNSIVLKGLLTEGDTEFPLELNRVTSGSNPWDYQIDGSTWELQNTTVTPQMLGYLTGAPITAAIQHAGAYCDYRNGCTIDLPGQIYTEALGTSLQLTQHSNWTITFQPGAKIVSGAGQDQGDLIVYEYLDSQEKYAEQDTLTINNPNFDVSADRASTTFYDNRPAIEVGGQKSVVITNPVIYGGTTYSNNTNSGAGIAITLVGNAEIDGGMMEGFPDCAIYAEGQNLTAPSPYTAADETSVVTVNNMRISHTATAVCGKRDLAKLVVNNLIADYNLVGVGSYPAGGTTGVNDEYDRTNEPAAQEVDINGGSITHSGSNAIHTFRRNNRDYQQCHDQ